MSYQQNNQQERKKPRAPFDLFSLTMWAPSPTLPGKNASLNYGVNPKGDITITCRSGDPADKEKTKAGDGDMIRATLPLKEFNIFLRFFEEALRSKEEYKRCVDSLGWFGLVDGQRKMLDKPRTESQLWIGKDRDGKMFISLTKYKRTNIEFSFNPERPAFYFRHANGEQFSVAEESVAYAAGYLNTLKDLYHIVRESDIVHSLYAKDYEERYDPKKSFSQNNGSNSNGGNGQRSGGGGGYGGGNSGGGGGGNRAPVNDLDDDMPF